ncbi:MAG: T9SS type A sorting domain-containing protein [Cytophagaceae bacterium]
MLLIKKYIIACLTCLMLFSFGIVSAQVPPNINSGNPNFPFPQFLGYPGGTNTLAQKNPIGVPHAEMEQRMRDAYTILCNNMMYNGNTVAGVRYIQPNTVAPISHCTCVEGDAYNLLAAAYMGDKTTFDGYFMWMHDRQFQKTQRYIDGVVNSPGYNYSPGISGAGSFGNSTNVYGGALGGNSAADGDVDLALALLMAWKQWGEWSGITPPAPYTGGQISYKAEAIKYIRTMVDTLPYAPSLPIKKYISGVIGFDGYMKSGDTWNETSTWAMLGQPGYTVLPERTGGDQNYVDYHAPAYFRDFADMLQAEGQPAWSINQYRRGDASSDWVMGQAYAQGYIPWIGRYQVTGTTVNFATFISGGEDFRYGWRTILNYLWHGAPAYTWNPTTHQPVAGTNTYNLQMAQRFAQFLKNPQNAPYNNTCFNAAASIPGLTIGGPSNIRWEYAMNGTAGGSFSLPMPFGPASPSAVVANDWDLMAQLFRQCVIVFDDQGNGGAQRYLTATPQYFHEWFRLLGMLVLTGNFQSPMAVIPKANLKIYKSVNKTFAYVGDTITYTVSYRNYGKPNATNVVIKDTLDAGYAYIAGSSTKAVSLTGNILTWNIGAVPGMTGGIVANTIDSLKFKVVVLPTAPSRICNTASITENGTFHWKSNEYPNRITEVMERNCVDILTQKPLSIKKTVDKTAADPGDDLEYTIVVKNKPTPFLNGGRSGVYVSGATDGVSASQSSLLLKYRITHGAHEPLINYKNYRVSYYMFQTPIPTWGLTTTIAEGTADPVTYVNTYPTLTQQSLVPGANWNHRFIITFPNRLATTTYRLTDNRGDRSKIHQGALEPLRLVNQIYAGWVNFNASDDWSAEPGITAADGAAYFPITNDWTDPLNLNIPVNKILPDQCGTIATTVKKQLVEEWDGYTWRRVYGDAPVSGRELTNIVVQDFLPPEVTFKNYLAGYPTGTLSGGKITFPTIPLLLTGDSVVYKFVVTVKTPCTNPLAVNVAAAVATNEPIVRDTARTTISGCLLPLDIISFTGQLVEGNKAKLNWLALEVESGTKYELQYSTDAKTFSTIYTTAATTNVLSQQYEFVHAIPATYNYYRIKYTEPSGLVNYTKVIQVSTMAVGQIRISPNPTSGKITIYVPTTASEWVSLKVYDVTGKIIEDENVLVSSGSIDYIMPETSGAYMVVITTEDANTVTRVIVE